jgi:hypothetical protein
MDDWSASVRDPALADGVVAEEVEGRNRERRARALACWLHRHAGSPLAERVVGAAGQVMVNVLDGEVGE